VLANQRRGERRRSALADRMRAEARDDPATGAPSLEDLGLADAFARLSAADREVLALESWEGLGPQEIGAVLGCSQNAARIRLHRARHRLRALMDAGEDIPASAPTCVLRGEPA
jgi:RNA polymerase sigma-70 factor (ECF subfamily)